MKRFWGFVVKEFFHIFRDYKTMIILFGMPIAQILIFGYVVTNEIENVKIGIYDKSKDPVTQEITDKILSSGFFKLEKLVNSTSEIEGYFKEGNIKEVIVFESDFSAKLERNNTANIQILADASDANTANMIVNYTSSIIYDYIRKMNLSVPQAKQIVPEIRMLYNESLKGVYMFVPGTIALILMLVSAMMTSISIAREKELGTMEAILVSPLKPAQIIIGKVTPYVALSFINSVVIIVLGFFVFNVPVQGSVILLLAECILYISLALSIGILISTLTKTQQFAMIVSMLGLMLPTLLLSGFIFPIENMPKIFQWLTYIMPPRWFITIIKNIMLKGTGFLFVWKETLILTGMMIFFITLSVRKFKLRLE